MKRHKESCKLFETLSWRLSDAASAHSPTPRRCRSLSRDPAATARGGRPDGGNRTMAPRRADADMSAPSAVADTEQCEHLRTQRSANSRNAARKSYIIC